MSVAVCIFAKNESRNIESILSQLAEQNFLNGGTNDVVIHVVGNGCTDDTVVKAEASARLFKGKPAALKVHDLHPGGKSRAWNRAVHDLVDPASDKIVFLDADIEFVDSSVIADIIASLNSHESAAACAGYPVKNIDAKEKLSVVDWFSLLISSETRHVRAISGQLYVAHTESLRDIWLPDETPGEDGFLNAMITTRGFSAPPEPNRVVASKQPTHYFETHGSFQFIAHERRMIVGTVINRWIFEHLWKLRLSSSAGPLIREWNEKDPTWVEKLIRDNGRNRSWLIPSTIVFGRLIQGRKRSWLRTLAYLPFGLAATFATLPAAIAANRKLKRTGAANTW